MALVFLGVRLFSISITVAISLTIAIILAIFTITIIITILSSLQIQTIYYSTQARQFIVYSKFVRREVA